MYGRRHFEEDQVRDTIAPYVVTLYRIELGNPGG